MDAGQLMANMNKEVLKQPRGFIKLVQWVASIICFASIAGWEDSFSVEVGCGMNQKSQKVTVEFEYPFELDLVTLKEPICKEWPASGGTPEGLDPIDFMAHEAGTSQLFVFVGVISFLYCIGVTVFYVFFDQIYTNNDQAPIGDFGIHAAVGFLWFVSTIAWATSLTEIKYYTNPDEYALKLIHECTQPWGSCKSLEYPSYASLNISVIMGFLNMFLWWTNLWFIYKETKWFHKTTANMPPMPPMETQQYPPGGYDQYAAPQSPQYTEQQYGNDQYGNDPYIQQDKYGGAPFNQI